MNRFRPLFGGVFVAATSLVACGAASAAVFTTVPGSATQAPSPLDFPAITSAGNTGQTSLTSDAEDGIQLTVSASGGLGFIAASNNFGGGFGVAGNSSFDISGAESLTLAFDQDIYLDQLSFNAFTETESANIAIASLAIAVNVSGDETITPSVSGVTVSRGDANDITLNFTAETFQLSAGDSIVITQGPGTGTSGTGPGILVDSVSVSAVPEPGSMALLGLGTVFLIRRKH